MAKKARKRRKVTREVPAGIVLDPLDVKELQRGMRRLLALQAQRRALDRRLRQLTEAIRTQHNFVHSITAPKVDNVGELPGAEQEGR